MGTAYRPGVVRVRPVAVSLLLLCGLAAAGVPEAAPEPELEIVLDAKVSLADADAAESYLRSLKESMRSYFEGLTGGAVVVSEWPGRAEGVTGPPHRLEVTHQASVSVGGVKRVVDPYYGNVIIIVPPYNPRTHVPVMPDPEAYDMGWEATAALAGTARHTLLKRTDKGYQQVDNWTTPVNVFANAKLTERMKTKGPGGPSAQDASRQAVENLLDILKGRARAQGGGLFGGGSGPPRWDPAPFEQHFVKASVVRTYRDDALHRRAADAFGRRGQGYRTNPAGRAAGNLVMELSVHNRLPWPIRDIRIDSRWAETLSGDAYARMTGSDNPRAQKTVTLIHEVEAESPLILLPGRKATLRLPVEDTVEFSLSAESIGRSFNHSFSPAKGLGEDWLKGQVEALKDADVDVRRRAALQLTRNPCPDAADALLGAIGDTDPVTRAQAAQALAHVVEPPHAQALVRALDEADPSTSQAVRRALHNLGSAALPPLVQALKGQSPVLRAAAAQTLGAMGDATTVPALTAAMRDSEATVRVSALRALVEVGDTRVLPSVLQACKDTHADVRAAAADGLRRFADAGAVRALIPLIGDADAGVRLAAVQSLGKLGHTTVVRPGFPVATPGAFSALEARDATAAKKAILDAVNDTDPKVAAAASLAVRSLGLTGRQ